MRGEKSWRPAWRLLLSLSVGACAQTSSGPERVRSNGSASSSAGSAPISGAAGSGVTGASDLSSTNPLADAGVGRASAQPCSGMSCPVGTQTMRVPDDDGFSVADGDCDDFNAGINPGAYDIPGNGIDEDCQGGDAQSDSCDDMLAIDDSDPLAAARAIELCATSDESSRRWGVISARWTTPDGKNMPSSDLMHGILPNLGSAFTPRAGKALLAISSGVARAPGQKDFTADCSDSFSDNDESKFPMGFDGSSPSCPADAKATSIGDAIALELRVRMPTNVTALSYDSAFFTDEYPDYICSPFNDYFQVIVQPARMGASNDGNVEFDLDGNPVSVNNSLLRACTPGKHGGKTFDCPLGITPLQGTGFDMCDDNSLLPGGLFGGLFGGGNMQSYGASTGWLNTEFTVQPGEIATLLLTIWDSDDHALDSLALIDHVHFRLRTEPPPPEVPVTAPE